MGMDLVGAGGFFGWSNATWADLLELGAEFGWVPSGTGPPRGRLKAEWGIGAYFGNDGQRFYARDARALADALERAIAALRKQARPARTRAARSTDDAEARLAGRRPPRRGRVPTRPWGPQDIALLRKFIAYCRKGSFRIY